MHVVSLLLEASAAVEVHSTGTVQQPNTSADSPWYSSWRRPLTNVLADMDGGMAEVDDDADA